MGATATDRSELVATGPASPGGLPFTTLALCWIVGLVLGHWLGGVNVWLGLALIAAAIAIWSWRQRHETAATVAALITFAGLAASWLILCEQYTRRDSITAFIGERSQLAQITGIIDSPTHLATPHRGAFGAFAYQPPGTLFYLRVQGILVQAQEQRASGRLLARIDQADHRLRPGDRVQVRGWLNAIDGPVNPGEFDFRRVMQQRGIDGRITIPSRGNIQLLASGASHPASMVQRLRDFVAASALKSLRLGMTHGSDRLALLEMLLLGRTDDAPRDMHEAFRRVGLAHLLSISGAHLGILLGIVWLLARIITPKPPRAAMMVLIVLGLYLLAVPLRVPILRAATMAGLFAIGFASGRRVRAIELLSIAALVVLMARPGDLFSPGFQLSFGAVLGLLLFTRRVSHALWPPPQINTGPPTFGERALRWAVDYVAVSLVAFAVVLPLVAYHFQLITPLAVVLSILALPVLTAMLALGYAKILLGLALPSGGLVLSGPLAWIADAMIGLVAHAQTWPASVIELTVAPSWAWALTTMGVVAALLGGWFRGRRVAMPATVCLCLVWLWLPQGVPSLSRWNGMPALLAPKSPAATLHMFAVGDGSCFLLQLPICENGRRDTFNLMFDCGSQSYLDVGERSIGPALQTLGVQRINLVMLSHADLDHYGGLLDVMEQVPVDQVMLPPQMLEASHQRPNSATAYLIQGLTARGLTPLPVSRGWHRRLGDAQLELLWPPPDRSFRRANDSSLVLSVRTTDRRILFTGDIQQEAITGLLEAGVDLRADVAELAHHGSFVDASPAWLAAVSPTVVLQSSGRGRLHRDPWGPLLAEHAVQRYITALHGMVTLTITSDGSMQWTTFRNRPGWWMPETDANRQPP